MRIDILTLFPDMFPGYLGQSLLNKAIQRRLVSVHVHDIRQWTRDPHQKVDDRPYGGGPGMILMVEPVVLAVEAVEQMDQSPAKVILLSPQGQTLDQRCVERLAALPRMILVCGRYEGVDQRVVEILQPEEISVGDYVLNGGEVPAMTIIDATIRLIPGVLGDQQSSVDDSFSSGNRLLEYAQYTRPREYRGHCVPDVLLSGNHEEIQRWRQRQSLERTRRRRDDLMK